MTISNILKASFKNYSKNEALSYVSKKVYTYEDIETNIKKNPKLL